MFGINCRCVCDDDGKKAGQTVTTVPGTICALRAGMDFEYDPSDSELLKSLSNTTATKAERELMLAVLESAIEDFRKYASAQDQKGKLLYQNAQEWILERNNEWFLSFDSICQSLSISPDHLRRALLRRQQTKHKAA
jgi:hypothetical protein